TQSRALPAPDREEAERTGGARVGRRQRGAAEEATPRPGVGAGARACEAPYPHAPLHAHAVHAGLEARLPRRARPWTGARDLCAAPVLPGGWGHGAPGPAVGPGALVGLIPGFTPRRALEPHAWQAAAAPRGGGPSSHATRGTRRGP